MQNLRPHTQKRSAFFFHVSRGLPLPRKSETRSYEVPCHAESCQQTLSGNHRFSEHVCWICLLYCACHKEIHPEPDASSSFGSLLRRCRIHCACRTKPRLNLEKSLRNVLGAITAGTFSTDQRPKVLQEWCALRILTSK